MWSSEVASALSYAFDLMTLIMQLQILFSSPGPSHPLLSQVLGMHSEDSAGSTERGARCCHAGIHGEWRLSWTKATGERASSGVLQFLLVRVPLSCAQWPETSVTMVTGPGLLPKGHMPPCMQCICKYVGENQDNFGPDGLRADGIGTWDGVWD